MASFTLTNGDDTFPGVADNSGHDSIDARNGADWVDAGLGNDTIDGGAGNDTLFGGDGNDSIIGGLGNDSLIGGVGADTLDGGANTDTANYTAATAAVIVDLNLTGMQNTGGGGFDTLIGVENLVGSDFEDALRGTGGANAITGGAGNDTLSARAGNDTLDGGLGDDTVVIADLAASGIGSQAGGVLTLNTSAGIDVLNDVEWIRFTESTPDGDLLVQVIAGDAILEASDDLANVIENNTLNVAAGGVLNNDLDLDDTKIVTAVVGGGAGVAVAGLHGELTLDVDGSYSYVAAAATDAMAVGDSVVDTFVYTVDAGGVTETATLTVTIYGQNDDPIAAALSAASDENGPAVIVTAAFTEPDAGDTHSFSVNTTGTLGSVIDNADGTFEYSANGAFEALGQGETATDTFTYTVNDSNGGSSSETVIVTVIGQNDDPICSALAAAIEENGPKLTLSAVFTEHDLNDSHSFLVDTSGALGLVIDRGGGNFEYDCNGAFEYLAEGESGVDTFTYTVMDSHGALSTEAATITVNGKNDDPVAAAVAASANEDGPAIKVSASFSDVDLTDTHTHSVDDTATLGKVVYKGKGDFRYFTDKAFEHLNDGETATDTFSYTVTDNHGATSTETVTVTVVGADERFVGTSATETISGTAWNDDVLGRNGDDVLNGLGGDDLLIGNAGADVQNGGDGHDVVFGGLGDDLLAGGLGDDKLIGANGEDSVTYAASGAGVILNLKAGRASGEGDDLLASIENAIGSGFADRITGTSSGNLLQGGAGKDTLRGAAGNDTLHGANGGDILLGGFGVDTASYADAGLPVSVDLSLLGPQNTGGGGSDMMISVENLIGSAGNDTLTGSREANILEGGAGDDVLEGGRGADVMTGGAGADTFVFRRGSDFPVGAHDLITDLGSGDVISLLAIDAKADQGGNQAFTLVLAFSGSSGQAMLAYDLLANQTLLELDTDGDMAADYSLAIAGNLLGFTDFLL